MRTRWVWAGPLALLLMGAQAQPPAIPDAPQPHVDLPTAGVKPGAGTASSSSSGSAIAPEAEAPEAPATAPAPAPPSPAAPGCPIGDPSCIRVNVDEVRIPFTVKDGKGHLVPGIRQQEVKVYENGRQMNLRSFTDDALPMSVAIVIDQSMTHDQMDTVNNALGALQDAFTKYDEVAVFTYNKNTKQVTDFTGAQSPRATQAVEVSKASGRDALLAGSLGGPLAQTLVLNNEQFDPNTAPVRGHTGIQLNAPREVHPLNDAILAAATALSTQPTDRRRVVYVISNGNEYGSKASTKEVMKYLEVNGIEVDGTLVGDNSLPVLGMLDRIHLPLMMRDNVMTPYANATGGNIDAEFRLSSIEKSFARVASEARNRYTVTWATPEAFMDGKYRSVNITILRPGLTVIAPQGYYPESQELRRRPALRPAAGR